MPRGFTLIELLITLSVLGVLLGLFAPSYKSLLDKNRIVGLSSELQGFLLAARSESVMRNQDLWVHFTVSGASNNGDWAVELRDSNLMSGRLIQSVTGASFPNVYIDSTYGSPFKVEGVNGRITGGAFRFGLNENMSNRGSVTTYYTTGRIKVCGSQGNSYGFKSC